MRLFVFCEKSSPDWVSILTSIIYGTMLFGLTVITCGEIFGGSLFDIGFKIVLIGFGFLFLTIALLLIEGLLKKLKRGTNE